jgi:hypothetical protein
MQDLIFKTIVSRKRRVGVVVAKKFPELNIVCVTGSLCHLNKESFNMENAMALAEDRANAMALCGRKCAVPFSLRNEIPLMYDRAVRYFKGCTVVSSPVKDNTPKDMDVVDQLIADLQ